MPNEKENYLNTRIQEPVVPLFNGVTTYIEKR